MVSLLPAELLDLLTRTRLVAIIRGGSGQAAVASALTLFDAGVRVVEVALTTPGALTAIERIAAATAGAARSCHVGAGTVLTRGDLAGAIAAGAGFVVTPGMTPAVPAAVDAGLPVLAGAYTATEAIAARLAGVTAVKLFPASVGGPAYLKALRDPLPDVPFIPVGGVGLAEAADYLRLGAVAVGVGSPLVGDAASGGDLTALAERARRYLAATAGAPGAGE